MREYFKVSIGDKNLSSAGKGTRKEVICLNFLVNKNYHLGIRKNFKVVFYNAF